MADHDDEPFDVPDVVAERLGAERSAELTQELAEAGLVIISCEELAALREAEVRYRRLAEIAAGPDFLG